MYRLLETKEAKRDLDNLAAYMAISLKNSKAAIDFLSLYHQQTQSLILFPFAYRGVSFTYQGYEIRMKTFSSYNIFFIIDSINYQIIILRILKDRQNWKSILKNKEKYTL